MAKIQPTNPKLTTLTAGPEIPRPFSWLIDWWRVIAAIATECTCHALIKIKHLHSERSQYFSRTQKTVLWIRCKLSSFWMQYELIHQTSVACHPTIHLQPLAAGGFLWKHISGERPSNWVSTPDSGLCLLRARILRWRQLLVDGWSSGGNSLWSRSSEVATMHSIFSSASTRQSLHAVSWARNQTGDLDYKKCSLRVWYWVRHLETNHWHLKLHCYTLLPSRQVPSGFRAVLAQIIPRATLHFSGGFNVLEHSYLLIQPGSAWNRQQKLHADFGHGKLYTNNYTVYTFVLKTACGMMLQAFKPSCSKRLFMWTAASICDNAFRDNVASRKLQLTLSF